MMISSIGKKHFRRLLTTKSEQECAEYLKDIPKSELIILMMDAGSIIDIVLNLLGADKNVVNH